jgi:hypothetical protein
MMKQINIKRISILALAFVLAACAEIQVNSDYDTQREFTALKTYTWMEPKQKLVLDPLVDNDLMNNRVRRAVEAQLAADGYQKAQGDQSIDFLITYHVSAETAYTVSSFHNHFGYYPCTFGCRRHGFGHGLLGTNNTVVKSYKRGTFMLDVIDPASTELIWRGSAGKRLSTGTPQERDTAITEIVAAILVKFLR